MKTPRLIATEKAIAPPETLVNGVADESEDIVAIAMMFELRW